MDNLDDSENNAKISDSAYSNSCSNSQSRRSHSSKSTHSGSHSSGSSGYGGKPSTSGSSNQPPEKRGKEKDSKKKKQIQEDTLAVQTRSEEEFPPPQSTSAFEAPLEEKNDVVQSPTPLQSQTENVVEKMEIVPIDRGSSDELVQCNIPSSNSLVDFVTNRPALSYCSDGFSCVISMHDGVVMYTTSSLTSTLGFPKDMWVGRSFIDFVHPRDRHSFAAQITNGLAVPEIVNTNEKVHTPGNTVSTMVCRIRRYRGLVTGFVVKERGISFMPFFLKLTFKNIRDDDGKVTYLVIQATPFYSAFKVPNERLSDAVPFVIRHAANGLIEYLDPESVPYLGYLPQDMANKDALQLYHSGDLGYLRHVYETIVKEGGMPRCKPYRMMAQNGDFIKLETEWSSFINPWSKKLEFVIGKHFIIEGPLNPDVFQMPEPNKNYKFSDEERNNGQLLRENIIRVLNELPTKPAEVAKQQMTKRCQDLASFMESLIEEPEKAEGEFRLEIQEQESSFYERDSVMLGGISPHHDNSDSKSSTATPLSYNQLNYNETLQRYFHQLHQYVDYSEHSAGSSKDLNNSNLNMSCPSPMALNSGDSGGRSSSCDSCILVAGNSPRHLDDYQHIRLTESLICKHNTEMEKELIKMHRENRSSKSEREKASNESRKKKKEHLARCNAAFHPTSAGDAAASAERVKKQHGIKRTKPDSTGSVHKHHCTSPRTSRTRNNTSSAPAQSSSTITTTVASSHWPTNPMNNMNTFIVGVGMPQQMSLMSPMVPQHVAHMPGMFPMYYAPATGAQTIPPIQSMPPGSPNCDPAKHGFQPPAMQCMVYGQAIYGSPFMYSPIGAQVSYPMPHTTMAQSMQYTNAMKPLGLTSSNYEEACKPSMHLKSARVGGGWRENKWTDRGASSKTEQESGESNSSNNALARSTEPTADSGMSGAGTFKRSGHIDEMVDKTDGESSYSSFYSSFFKTESGSADDSGDAKKINKTRFWDRSRFNNDKQSSSDAAPSLYEPQHVKNVPRRKMEPPWMEQVCLTSELIYKYQIMTKTVTEVLTSDEQKLANVVQPSLVNEQLNQLYLELQLEGVTSRLTLEEGITSSSSSGEDTSHTTGKTRRKRKYSKLGLIYEEDAPLPSPEAESISDLFTS